MISYSILRAGITEKLDPELHHYVSQVNFNGLLFFVLDLILALIFLVLLGDMYLSFIFATAGFAFLVTSIGFNFFGFTTLSRLSTVTIGSALIMICSFYLGLESMAHVSLMLGAIFPFVYFNPRERHLIAITIAIPILSFVFLTAMNFHLGPSIVYHDSSTPSQLSFIAFIVPLLGIYANSYRAFWQLMKKTAQLRESEGTISALFNALSHDLATPLTLARLIVAHAKKARHLDSKGIDRMDRAVSQMVRILEKLRKIAVLSTGKGQLSLEVIGLQSLINEAVDNIRELATQKKVRLTIEEDVSINDLKVKVDRDIFLFQVLNNVLYNALKFSFEDSEIKVKISLRDKEVVLIQISDSGIGIDPDMLPKLFSWTTQTTRPGTRGERGSGLGMPLVKKFLELMGGAIFVTSRAQSIHKIDHGTDILIILPVHRQAGPTLLAI